jgi:16S rRNA A1518/A1519 N6-dimethyltransferase RsmA/KsgA/DIM1 with predicted DNA glycosylase/AP lyase activity
VDKKPSVAAAIVRVLKQKNRPELAQLESDVVQALQPYFRAELATIRSSLKELIRDEYCSEEVEGGQKIHTYRT